MAAQGEQGQGGFGFNVESMARDGSFYNFNPWGSSTPYSEHELCWQTESHNGGAIAPRRGTEQAAIFSATNSTTQGECFRSPLQTTWAWQVRQVDIGELRTQLEEEWKTKLEEQKLKHNLELEKLKREVRTGQFKRETLKGEIKWERNGRKD